MNKVLENKYPYLSNFFKTAINENRLFHSIILQGSNNYIQYAMALELARQLNCLEDKREDCTCQNCRWIRDNQHPAVMTISKIDNKNDDRRTVISEKQIDQVLDMLVSSSDYHRVFIFCDAEMKKLKQNEIKEYEEFKSTGFVSPQVGHDEKIWYPTSINRKCISDHAINSMLKTLEEPNSNLTFIFLTENKDDLLQTVVSRSQAFFMPNYSKDEYSTGFFQKYFNNYPQFNKEYALDFAQTLLTYQTENNLEPIYVIDCIQYYLTELLKVNSHDNFLVKKIYKDIEKTENSKKMLKAYIKEPNVYEDLAFYFTKC